MMGTLNVQGNLFSYQMNLERRVRANNPLRAIREQIDFRWVRVEMARHYRAQHFGHMLAHAPD